MSHDRRSNTRHSGHQSVFQSRPHVFNHPPKTNFEGKLVFQPFVLVALVSGEVDHLVSACSKLNYFIDVLMLLGPIR